MKKLMKRKRAFTAAAAAVVVAERREGGKSSKTEARQQRLHSSLSYQTLTAASFSSSLLFSRFLRLLSR